MFQEFFNCQIQDNKLNMTLSHPPPNMILTRSLFYSNFFLRGLSVKEKLT